MAREGDKVEAVTDFISLDSTITVDGDCSHEIKRHLLLGRKAMANIDSIIKSRDIKKKKKAEMSLCRQRSYSQSYVFSSSIINKAEGQKIDAFKLWCWRSLLRVLWKARRSNQSILKPINPEYSLEGLSSNTLATPCEESSPWKRPWCWERLKAKGEEDEKVR